jgi:hypothetical protein
MIRTADSLFEQRDALGEGTRAQHHMVMLILMIPMITFQHNLMV